MSIVARDAKTVKSTVLSHARLGGVSVEPGMRGAITGLMNKCMGGDEKRRLALGWLFDKDTPISCKELTNPQWFALHVLVDPHKGDTDGKWETAPCFPAEAALIVTEAIRHYSSIKRSEFILDEDGMIAMVPSAVAYTGATITAITDHLGNSTHIDGVEFPESAFADTEKWNVGNVAKIHTQAQLAANSAVEQQDNVDISNVTNVGIKIKGGKINNEGEGYEEPQHTAKPYMKTKPR